uniref:Uncharacterized protein n=1 Tax=Anguilla anguilla TaxID=7936 RepID=A0A0E9SE75_ANGAN
MGELTFPVSVKWYTYTHVNTTKQKPIVCTFVSYSYFDVQSKCLKYSALHNVFFSWFAFILHND